MTGRYVLHVHVIDYMRLGWMWRANLSDLAALMVWPCACAVVEPKRCTLTTDDTRCGDAPVVSTERVTAGDAIERARTRGTAANSSPALNRG